MLQVSTVLGVVIPSEREQKSWTEGVAIWVAVAVVSGVGESSMHHSGQRKAPQALGQKQRQVGCEGWVRRWVMVFAELVRTCMIECCIQHVLLRGLQGHESPCKGALTRRAAYASFVTWNRQHTQTLGHGWHLHAAYS